MSKRVKLKVKRHRLPDIDLLWIAKDFQGRAQCTIANLIDEVNISVPLQAGDWALDDYVVEVGGYECLHYSYVSDLLREGDEVTIRPLESPDVKARRLGGRTQITAEGFHILDGVPFGMQPGQRPHRPAILIPSRKRRRPQLDEEDYADGQEQTVADLEDDEDKLAQANVSGVEYGDEEELEEEQRRPKKKQKQVHFKIVKDIPNFDVEEADGDEDEDEDEDDDDFNPEAVDEDDDSEDDDIASDDSRYRITGRVNADGKMEWFKGDRSARNQVRIDGPNGTAASVASSDSDAESSDETSSSESDSESGSGRDSDSESSSDDSSKVSAPEIKSAKQPNGTLTSNGTASSIQTSAPDEPKLKGQPSPPGEGKNRSRSRNRRKKILDRLVRLVQERIDSSLTRAGALAWGREHPEAFHTMREQVMEALDDGGQQYEVDGDGEESLSGDVLLTQEVIAPNEHITTPSRNASTADVVAVDAKGEFHSISKTHTPLQEKRQELLDALESGGVVNSASSKRIQSITQAEEEVVTAASKHSSRAIESNDAKRVRLNIDGSRRAIFGALGQRTPKNQQDADRVRDRLAGKGKSLAQTTIKQQDADESNTTSDAWRSKIRLSAVDCDDPTKVLSEPPYPFKQRWDISQQIPVENGWWANGGKQRKKKGRNSYGHNFSAAEDVSYLDYDEHEGDYEAVPDMDVEETGEGLEDIVPEAEASVDDKPTSSHTKSDLPSLPADMSTLADLDKEGLERNAVIAFRQLECSEATNWAPVMSKHRTAKIIDVLETDQVEVQLAARDREVKHKRYDQEGNRVYAKFEMGMGDDDEEDEEDDGHRVIGVGDMVEAKLVQPGQ